MGTNNNNGVLIALLTCSVQMPKDLAPVISTFDPLEDGVYPNPWRYTLNGTNNPGHYDLWVDIVQGGKTSRISNWNTKPEIIYEP